MYVCLCRSITDRQIREATCQGVRCNRDLNTHIGQQPQCGQCAMQTRQIISQTLSNLTKSNSHSAN